MAHRECMKKFLVQNQVYGCDVCKANYAVGKSPSRVFHSITPNLITMWLGRFFIVFLFIVVIILTILYITTFTNDTDVVEAWKIGLIVLFSISMLLVVIYVVFVVHETWKKLSRTDLEVYCNQTEIGLHTKNAKEILKDYYDNALHFSLIEDYNMIEDNDEKEEIARKGIHQATNASILNTKEDEKIKKLKYEQELGNLDNILNIYDEGEDMETKKRNDDFEKDIEIPITRDSRRKYLAKVQENQIPNDIIDEMSSIRVDQKDITNSESFHSVNNAIEENMHAQDKTKKTSNYNGQAKHKTSAASQSEEEKENKQSKRHTKRDNYEQHGITSELQKTVNQYGDVDLEFHIQPELRNNKQKVDRERSLSLSLTNNDPITYT